MSIAGVAGDEVPISISVGRRSSPFQQCAAPPSRFLYRLGDIPVSRGSSPPGTHIAELLSMMIYLAAYLTLAVVSSVVLGRFIAAGKGRG